ncbi:MAG: radical SAM family heme chaperone HemW [Myxococcales bacterium]|nr:radical SAM family heme chaperone HemW [Myxococcales bacterium]
MERATIRAMHVYVHFPWCLEKCPYCDFVSYRATREAIDPIGYTHAVITELERRLQDCTEGERSSNLESIFFGGGTPSLWEPVQLGRLLAAIRASFPIHSDLEITVECNPSSLDLDRAQALRDVGVNRLSLGVQSLNNRRLRFLGRLHDAESALRSLRAALASGIPRVSVDLLYAVADQRPEEAVAEALRLLDEGILHLSAYSLTIEQGTRFGELARRGRLPLADEGTSVETFFALHEALEARGLLHYEVSNYAAPGQASRHNLGYWKGHHYLGLGCAAVGMIRTARGSLRYRNQTNPARYQAACAEAPTLEPGELSESIEALDGETLLRERIMLGLRLAGGFDLEQAAAELGVAPWPPARIRAVERMAQRGRLLREEGRLRVPLSAWLLADGTAAELF